MRGLSLRILCAFLFLSYCSALYGQKHKNLIRGKVYDAGSGLPLPAVNVYLSNTTIGDATDTLGIFEITNIPAGNYDLVYQFIGYEQLVTNINVGRQDTLIFEASLSYSPYQLDSLVVSEDRSRLWQRNLNRFIRHFIGRSNNANQTSLLNAEVLDFNIESFGVYSAKAQRELHIVNKALGYESFIHLKHFEWNYFDDTGQALYYVRMKEIKPMNMKQKKEWAMKRSETYDKSIRMFFKGVLDVIENEHEKDREDQNGLRTLTEIYYRGNRYKLFNGDIQKLNDKRKFEQYAPENYQYQVWGFKFNTFYGKMPLSVIPDNGEVSYFDYYDKEAAEYIFVLDQNGHLLNPLDIAIGGFWSNFRFADFVPLNYRPEMD